MAEKSVGTCEEILKNEEEKKKLENKLFGLYKSTLEEFLVDLSPDTEWTKYDKRDRAILYSREKPKKSLGYGTTAYKVHGSTIGITWKACFRT